MVVVLVAGTSIAGIFTGLSSDAKPAAGEGFGTGALFIETDTNKLHQYNGTAWTVVSMPPQVTPAQITGNQNNYDPTTATTLRLDSDGNYDITGISGGVDGRVLKIINVGVNRLSFTNQDASSSAANRIITRSGGDFEINSNEAGYFEYDATDSRWRQLDLG